MSFESFSNIQCSYSIGIFSPVVKYIFSVLKLEKIFCIVLSFALLFVTIQASAKNTLFI